ncbi:hypothetical protein JTE90_028422 [Oedothorax gibbosus]|uniref:DNA-binding protein SMUBP-2 n=1 Tax=Oedothorax gibbosus TaxID=931172 RepID=A0AAV6VHV7_9ARAC|nr:hypothetical protein JTE90_028422 [Oedothorax gibbosus]
MTEDHTDIDISKPNVEQFACKHLELIEDEKNAEVEENKYLQECISVKRLQKKGVCIPKLRIRNFSTGLFGRSIINFEPFWRNGPLPSHTISPGDIVGVGNLNRDGKPEIITSGVVTKVSDTVASVAFEKNADFSELEYDVQYMIIKLANDVTYKRLKRVLKTLESKGREYFLADVLFGGKEPSTIEELNCDDITFVNENLNTEQKEAVKFALKQKEVAIIHGPPGTGKTTTVVECILQAVAQKLKILACAPSNIAVDNLVEKLAAHKVKMVRLGHPARFLTSIHPYSLDSIVSRYDGSEVIDEMHKEIDKLRDKIGKTKGSNNRRTMWAENRSLLKEVKEREKLIVAQVLKNADVILCTLTSGSNDGPLKYVPKDHFNVCFIDECSQAIEAACWIPLVLVKKCILAGDHNQLPPTIISKKAAKEGLEVTLMERLLKLHGDGIKKMLTTQYRMNQVIMQWPSEQLYEGKLRADDSVRSHLLTGLPNMEENEDTSIPLLLIDTTGSGLHELQAEDEESKGNEGEADLVAMHVKNLIKSGLNPVDVAVVTPYNLQVELIKARLAEKYPKLEIKSVDGFQGREKEAIVLSLVRSNDSGEVGFLAEDRRINVAITRAKRHLAVICDSKTVSYHGFLKSFVNYCEEHGEVRTAFQYEREIGNYPSVKHSISNVKLEEKKVPSRSANQKGGKTDAKKKPIVNKKMPFSERKVTLHSEEEKQITEEKYEEIIQKFIQSRDEAIIFSTSLSAFERRAVHEVAEKLNLVHISTGEGTERCIQVSKKLESPSKPLSFGQENTSSSSTCKENSSGTLLLDKSSNQNASSSSSCKQNSSESLLLNKSSNPTEDIPHEPNLPPNPIKKKKKPTKPKSNPKQEEEEEEDFDALINQVMKEDKTCFYKNCKCSILVLAQLCKFCNKRFCCSHFIPEAHGCGDAAKMHARAQIRKDGVLYAGSGKPQKKVDPIKHNYLQKKLDKKLTEMSSKRKPQKKDDKS